MGDNNRNNGSHGSNGMDSNGSVSNIMEVDRRLLEHILQAEKYVVDGEHLFDRIASKFKITSIFPSRGFHIGAKSRKAPTVCVLDRCGNQQAVDAACGELAMYFDTETNKIVAHVAIPPEKHYYVIGKEGCNVRPLMSTSGCYIHFPETSRDLISNSPAKNHVTITGVACNVEAARVELRKHMPIIISFAVPPHIPTSETTMTPQIRSLARKYSLTIFFKQMQDARYMFFKGPRRTAHNIELAASEVLSNWNVDRVASGHSSPSTPLSEYNIYITVQFDVPSVYHTLIKENHALIGLAQQTQTRVSFHREGVSSILYISGPLNDIKVVMAQLQCELPYSISFQLPEDITQDILALSEQSYSSLDGVVGDCVSERVSVSVQLIRSQLHVTVHGREGGVGAVYRARRQILQHFKCTNLHNYGHPTENIDTPDIDFLEDDAYFFPPYHGSRFSALFGHPERMPRQRSRQTSEQEQMPSPSMSSSTTTSDTQKKKKKKNAKNFQLMKMVNLILLK
eukprot:m.90211 g.90211  ORF g.90211 m.90211 type:complete len:511 (-) comp12302_c4_seq4:354-1886(-)